MQTARTEARRGQMDPRIKSGGDDLCERVNLAGVTIWVNDPACAPIRPDGRRRDGRGGGCPASRSPRAARRSEEHTSELQSLMRISYAVFCLQKKKTNKHKSNCHRTQLRK